MSSTLKKWLAAAFAVVLMATVVGVVYGFTPKNKPQVVLADTPYFYTDASTDFEDMLEPSNWHESPSEDYECGGSAQIPCSITVPEGQTINSVLASYETKELSDLLTDANGRRQEAEDNN